MPIRGAPGRTGPRAAPSRSTRTGSGPHSRSRPSIWTSSSPKAGSAGSVAPAIPGLNVASAPSARSTAAVSAARSGSRNVASGASRWADPRAIPRRTPSSRAAGLASSTTPSVQGCPPRTSGPVGNEPELRSAVARARASRSGRCGQKRWRSRTIVGPWLEGGGGVGEERVAEEAGVATATLRVEDPELHPPPRRAGPVPGDHHLRPLADDIPAEPDPGPSGELEPEAGRLGDCARDRSRQADRLEDDEEDVGSPGEGHEPTESIRDRRRPSSVRRRDGGWAGPVVSVSGRAGPVRSAGRSTMRRSTERPAISAPAIARASSSESGSRTTSHSSRTPRPTASTGSRLRARSSVGDDRARRLGLRREPEGEGRLAARPRPAHGQRGRAGYATGTEDRVKLREPGPDDPIVVRGADRDGRGRRRSASRVRLVGERDRGQRPDDASGSTERVPPNRGAASPQRVRRDARAAVTSEEGVAIGRLTIEQMFYHVKTSPPG